MLRIVRSALLASISFFFFTVGCDVYDDDLLLSFEDPSTDESKWIQRETSGNSAIGSSNNASNETEASVIIEAKGSEVISGITDSGVTELDSEDSGAEIDYDEIGLDAGDSRIDAANDPDSDVDEVDADFDATQVDTLIDAWIDPCLREADFEGNESCDAIGLEREVGETGSGDLGIDENTLIGIWEGKEIGLSISQSVTFEFTDTTINMIFSEFGVQKGKWEFSGTYHVNNEAIPYRIDITIHQVTIDSDRIERSTSLFSIQGIYKIEDDVLTMEIGFPGYWMGSQSFLSGGDIDPLIFDLVRL